MFYNVGQRRTYELGLLHLYGWKRVGVVKLLRAWGGCLGVIRKVSVEGCEMLGEAAERATIPRYSQKPRELKHLSTWRKRNQQRLP